MNLQEFNSPLPKPWLNIRCASLVSTASFTGLPTYTFSSTIATGAGSLTLTPGVMVGGVLIIQSGRSAGISLPLSAAIDAYIASFDIPVVDGLSFQLNVINREATNNIALSSAEVNGQTIPHAQSASVSTSWVYYFQRVAGVYLCFNN